jgi:SAM-dependent methyltransferase
VTVLDLACGGGRHALGFAARGCEVTGVDRLEQSLPGIRYIQADLEHHEYAIEGGAWDLIVCWLYWQPDLLPSIARGVREGGFVALAGKTTGRFATSLANYRAAFPGFTELASGEDAIRAFFFARRGLAPEKPVYQTHDLLRLFGVVDGRA